MGKLKVYFSVWGSIFSSLWQYKFGKKYTIYYASGWGLLKREIGLPLSSEKDWKVTFRVLIQIFNGVLNNKPIKVIVGGDGVLISNSRYIEFRKEYLKYFDKNYSESYNFFPSDELIFGSNILNRPLFICLSFFVSVFIFPLSLISKRHIPTLC